MILTPEKQADLAECLLEMGALLLDCGAEISRVEDTLRRSGMAYGAVHVDAFVITSIISLSMEFSEESIVTETRRIYSSAGTDFTRLEKLNALSRRCCAEPIPVCELRKCINDIAAESKPAIKIFFGSALAAGSFAVFFGGSIWDGVSAAVFALLICLMQRRLDITQVSIVGFNLILSLLTGLGIGFLCAILQPLHMDKIMIGDIMLLIPGLAMTNSIRNILGGNTISGVIRLTECLIWAVALAGGFMTAMLITSIIL